MNEKNLVLYLESDDSGEEDNSKDHSNETDTSFGNVHKKKRKRKAQKENHELDEFVEEFNEMCKEVESFSLVVEKST